LIALTEGELDWDQATGDFGWSEATPLPTALKSRFASEPRWIDLRPYRDGSIPKGIEFLALGADFASAIQGIPKEDLLSQEVRQQRRARTLAGTTATVLVVLLMAVAWEWNQARLQRNEAQFQRDTARMQLLTMEARRAAAGDASDEIERAGALALESIEFASKSNLPTEADAIEAARSALIRLPLVVLSHGTRVSSLTVSADGRLVSAGGGDGKIKLWPKDGAGEPTVLSHGNISPDAPTDDVLSLAVLPDGRLASAGDNGGCWCGTRRTRGPARSSSAAMAAG
jgi:hypothetical protein